MSGTGMTNTGVMILTCLIMVILIILIYLNMFGGRDKKSDKRLNRNKNKIKENLSVSAKKQQNENFKLYSKMLNKLPVGRLTEEKREEINKKLAAIANADEPVRIAEEIHVQQWLFAVVWILFVIVLGFIFDKRILYGLIGTPIAFGIPLTSMKMSVSEEEAVLEREFRNFYNLYYVQFQRAGYSIRLVDVVQSYKGIAPPEMSMFISRLEVDAQTSEIEALKMLKKRYANNQDVHRFCSVATLVSRGDGNASKVVESMQEDLTQKKINAQMKELQRRKNQVESVISAMLFGICTVMMVITFASVMGA